MDQEIEDIEIQRQTTLRKKRNLNIITAIYTSLIATGLANAFLRTTFYNFAKYCLLFICSPLIIFFIAAYFLARYTLKHKSITSSISQALLGAIATGLFLGISIYLIG